MRRRLRQPRLTMKRQLLGVAQLDHIIRKCWFGAPGQSLGPLFHECHPCQHLDFSCQGSGAIRSLVFFSLFVANVTATLKNTFRAPFQTENRFPKYSTPHPQLIDAETQGRSGARRSGAGRGGVGRGICAHAEHTPVLVHFVFFP